jgi:pyruvate/2-oxoacid:ferredoxin oxidoreductase beta subunit
MDKFSLYVSNFLPCKEYFVPEKNQACPGCGLALAIRQTYKTLEKGIEKASWQPLMEGDTRKKALDIFGGAKTEVSFLQIPKGKADLIVCLDNEVGGSLNEAIEKTMPSVAVAEGFQYVATACPSHPFDLYEKVKRGFQTEGKAYIHILSPCPQEWQFEPELTVKIGRWAVESRAFPLYEVGGGVCELTVTTPKPRLLADYLKAQKRFENLSEKEIDEAQVFVENEYKKLIDAAQKYLDTTG